jgi:hypothetical protein
MQSLFSEDSKDQSFYAWMSWNLPTILLMSIGLPMVGFVLLSFTYGATSVVILFIKVLLQYL